MLFALFLAAISSQRFNANGQARRLLEETPTTQPTRDSINSGTYAGATAGVVLGLFVVLVIVYCFGCRPREGNLEHAALVNSQPLTEEPN